MGEQERQFYCDTCGAGFTLEFSIKLKPNERVVNIRCECPGCGKTLREIEEPKGPIQ